MKKFYILASALLAVSTLKAQLTTVDFEDLTLPSVDTFYTGEDYAGQFTSNGVIFGNSYEVSNWGGVWEGFAYSNVTDNTTAGLENQYSAFAGGGANGSEIYSVYTSKDTLYLPSPSDFGSVSIVNTTYAGISMRDGDQFAKQFGSPYDANGDLDGTDGKDYFYITIYGWNDNNQLVDSTEIYLADFRSADATDHYILNQWTAFDLWNLNGSSYLTFDFTSSDVGQWGINTPKYFAMDNLEYKESVASLNLSSLEMDVYPNPSSDVINIISENGTINLMNLNGRVLKSFDHKGKSSISVSELPAGLYIIQLRTDDKVALKKLFVK